MESKFVMFSILNLKYDRLRTNSSEVELEIGEKVNATVKLTKSKKFLVRIKVEVNIAPRTDESELMISLITASDYEFPEDPQKNDVEPCIIKAINSTRKALRSITEAFEITPVDLDEISVTDLEQM